MLYRVLPVIDMQLNSQKRMLISSLLRYKLISSNQIIMRRCLNTNCDMFFTQSTCYTITRRSNTRVPLYTTSWLYPINSTENFIPKCRTFMKTVPSYPLRDLPATHEKNGVLVYAPVFGRLKKIMGISLFNCILVISMQPSLIGTLSLAVIQQNVGTFTAYVTLLFFILGMSANSHSVFKRFIVHIYYNEETKIFTATTAGFFLQPKELIFKAGEAKIPKNPKPFTNMEIKGEQWFINEANFITRHAYLDMIGYDIGELNSNTTKKTKRKQG